ncbi:DUF177 domain-containing protein [bacterium]|nr:DUF177 domain-containing protein [bacterium]
MIEIRVTDIPSRGLEISDRLSLSALNARMAEAPDNDVIFTEEPRFSIKITPEIAGAEVKGQISTAYQQPCGVCLEPLREELSQELQITLKAKSGRPGVDRATSATEWEDDIGIIYFNGEHIDLEEILQENLILAINPFSPREHNCPGIPAEHQESTEQKNPTLGDLIKNAQR